MNDCRSAQLFIALERCGAVFLHWWKGVVVWQGSSKGCDLFSCSDMFWARVGVHPFHSSASSWFVSDTVFINTHTSSYTELAEGLGQGSFGFK